MRSPTALEQFFLEPNNFDLLTQLLISGGIGKLFVYGRKPEMRSFIIEDLNMVPSLINLKVIFLTFFRATLKIVLINVSVSQNEKTEEY